MHGAEHPVAHRAERLEDGAVKDVGADRDLRVEPEDEDEDRRHQAAAAHAGHADEDPDERAREVNCQVIGARPGIGQETNGRPVSRQPSLYASQPVQKPVTAASSASAATSSAEHRAGDVPAERVGERRRAEHGGSDHVRGARRPAVLERALAEPRLHELEVREAGQAEAAPDTRPTTSCRASRPASQPQPASQRRARASPIVAWLKRGARESITAVSR